jgi:hypothetical protein
MATSDEPARVYDKVRATIVISRNVGDLNIAEASEDMHAAALADTPIDTAFFETLSTTAANAVKASAKNDVITVHSAEKLLGVHKITVSSFVVDGYLSRLTRFDGSDPYMSAPLQSHFYVGAVEPAPDGAYTHEFGSSAEVGPGVCATLVLNGETRTMNRVDEGAGVIYCASAGSTKNIQSIKLRVRGPTANEKAYFRRITLFCEVLLRRVDENNGRLLSGTHLDTY